MTSSSKFDMAAIREFDQKYDSTHEDIAAQVRGEFLQVESPVLTLQPVQYATYTQPSHNTVPALPPFASAFM